MPDTPRLSGSALHALCVYAEPLIAGRRVVLFGSATSGLGERLLDLGARLVHLYDADAARAVTAAAVDGLSVFPLPEGELDVRDGAFDLAVVPDLGEIPSAASVLARIRRVLAREGAAIVRARAEGAAARSPSRRGAVDYYQLYDLVAMQFAHVRMVGQLRWAGVALAELGRGDDEPDVTVDTQLVTEAAPPEAFIALGSQVDVALAEYALVQLPDVPVTVVPDVEAPRDRADLAAAQLRASLLEAQLDELRARRTTEDASQRDALAAAEVELADRQTELQRLHARAADASGRAEEAVALLRRRDEDLARLRDRLALASHELDEERTLRGRTEVELAAVRSALDQVATEAKSLSLLAARVPILEMGLAQLEAGGAELARRLAAAEEARALVESALSESLTELAALRAASAKPVDAPEDPLLPQLLARIASLEADLARTADGHGSELTALEEGLRERARAAHALEQEVARRERIILDLVHALDEARAGDAKADAGPADEARTRAALLDAESTLREARQRAERARAESDDLREKLDAASLEIARREAERTTAAWRIQELEQAVARLEDEQSELTMTIPPPAFVKVEREANDVTLLAQRLAAAEDEADLLRQALAQEHEARSRAESGAALAQAREELARQAALIESMSKELEARDAARRPAESAGGSTVERS
jgi:hypothetical protein